MGLSYEEIVAKEHGRIGTRRRWDGCNLRFFEHFEPNRKKTEEAGRLVTDPVECVEVWPPGGDRTVIKLEASHKAEYATEYNAWRATKEQPTSGTPLEEWSLLHKSVCEELLYLGIRTVEQLAEANDATKQKMGPLQTWCKKAADWIEAAKSKQSDVVALKQALEREQKKTKKLEEQMTLLMQRIDANEGGSLRDAP